MKIKNELIRYWLETLIDGEIKEELGAISNERFWQKGSSSDAEIAMREDNIQTHEEYLEILKDIKNAIENFNNITDFHAPNLVTEITSRYEDKIYFFEFMGFNTFDADYQHIVKEDQEDDHFVVPEFINIRNIKDSENNELVPDIEIYLV